MVKVLTSKRQLVDRCSHPFLAWSWALFKGLCYCVIKECEIGSVDDMRTSVEESDITAQLVNY